jgi:hypothetical protein
MESSSKSKARLIVFSIFSIGFLAGILAMNLYQHIRNNSPEDQPRGKPQDFIIKKMEQRMSLSTEQHTRIRSILDETFDRYKSLRVEMRDQIPQLKEYESKFDDVRLKQRERIREVLNEKQLPEFEKMLQEMEKRREEQRQEK